MTVAVFRKSIKKKLNENSVYEMENLRLKIFSWLKPNFSGRLKISPPVSEAVGEVEELYDNVAYFAAG